jgi:hypothetical protein
MNTYPGFIEERTTLQTLSAAVRALAGNELTLNEFRPMLDSLSSESLQVAATVLGYRIAMMPDVSYRMRAAISLCATRAANTRPLC